METGRTVAGSMGCWALCVVAGTGCQRLGEPEDAGAGGWLEEEEPWRPEPGEDEPLPRRPTEEPGRGEPEDRGEPDDPDEPDPDDQGDSVFIMEPDGGPPDIECDIWDPHCPAGQKCSVWATDGGNVWTATGCFDLWAEPAAAGEPCQAFGSDRVPPGVSGRDTCEAGSLCWDPDPETGIGMCVAFCIGSPDAPTCQDADHICNVGKEVVSLCLERCDPTVQDCPVGCACYPTRPADEFQCLRDWSGDEGAFGSPCDFPNECDPGFFCGSPDNVPDCGRGRTGCCNAFCDLAEPSCPHAHQVCLPWYPDPSAAPLEELANVGFCAYATP